MTYMTQLLINPQRRESGKILANTQALHAAVEACFPPQAGGRKLWRLDVSHPTYALYIVSDTKPDMTHMQESYGWETSPAKSVSLENLLGRLANGQGWKFRLAASTTKALNCEDGRRRHLTLSRQEDQLAWLLKRAEGWGFEVAPDSVRITKSENLSFLRDDTQKGGKNAVKIARAQFDGVLKVLDAEKFKEAILSGMGRNKGYGCGLMTIRGA